MDLEDLVAYLVEEWLHEVQVSRQVTLTEMQERIEGHTTKRQRDKLHLTATRPMEQVNHENTKVL